MEVQQEISLEKNQEKIGKTFKVIIDKKEARHYWAEQNLIAWRWIMK